MDLLLMHCALFFNQVTKFHRKGDSYLGIVQAFRNLKKKTNIFKILSILKTMHLVMTKGGLQQYSLCYP